MFGAFGIDSLDTEFVFFSIQTMAKVKAALEDVSLPTSVEAQPIEDDVEMESSTEGGEVEVEAEAEADVETASS